ncbi:MAG: hypothetical protein ACRDSJ_01255 [Rubrobacteraceae bacterium]
MERETAYAMYLRVERPEEESRLVDRQGVLVVRAQPSGGDLVNDLARDERDRRAAELLRRAGA